MGTKKTASGREAPAANGRRRSLASTRTRARKDAFIAALAETGIVGHACKAARVPRRTHNEWLSVDPEYAAGCDAAAEDAADTLEAEARHRAIAGSDRLIEFLLAATKPEKYRRRTQTELTGRDGGPVTINTAIMTDEQLAELDALLTLLIEGPGPDHP